MPPQKLFSKKKTFEKESLLGKSKRDLPIHEESAGGLVFKRTGRGIVFAMMVDSYGKWTFPKGHLEAGEQIEEAAARETLEELGLQEIRLIEYLGKIDIWFRDRFVKKGKLIHKNIHYFLFEAPMDALLEPDPKERVQRAQWVPASRILQKSFYQDMVPIIEEALFVLKHMNTRRR